MAKARTIYVCQNCGRQFPREMGEHAPEIVLHRVENPRWLKMARENQKTGAL